MKDKNESRKMFGVLILFLLAVSFSASIVSLAIVDLAIVSIQNHKNTKIINHDIAINNALAAKYNAIMDNYYKRLSYYSLPTCKCVSDGLDQSYNILHCTYCRGG